MITYLHLAIETRYGKNNPIYVETSKKKGQTIIKLSHSTKRPTGYSDLSTNSRSSLNNPLSKRSLSSNRLKDYLLDSEKRFSRTSSKRKLSDFEMLNQKATLLIEKAVYKPLFQIGPIQSRSVPRSREPSGYLSDHQKPKLRSSIKIKKKGPPLAPNARIKTDLKRTLVPSKKRTQKRYNSASNSRPTSYHTTAHERSVDHKYFNILSK